MEREQGSFQYGGKWMEVGGFRWYRWCWVVSVWQQWGGGETGPLPIFTMLLLCKNMVSTDFLVLWYWTFPAGSPGRRINGPLLHKPWPQNFNEGIMNKDQNYLEGSEKWFQPFWEHFLFICEDLDEMKAFDTREQQKWLRGLRPGLRGSISSSKALPITLGEASTQADDSGMQEPHVHGPGREAGLWKMENC